MEYWASLSWVKSCGSLTDLVLNFYVNSKRRSGAWVNFARNFSYDFGYNNVIRRFLCYFCSAVQLYTSTVVDSAVPDSGMVVEPFVGR